MINRLTALPAIALLSSTLTVNAATVEVHYEGFVNGVGGDGAGYSVNDTVSGSLFINTDLAPSDMSLGDLIGLNDTVEKLKLTK